MLSDSGREIVRLARELQNAQCDYLKLEDEIRNGNLGSDVISDLAQADLRVHNLMQELERLDWQTGLPV